MSVGEAYALFDLKAAGGDSPDPATEAERVAVEFARKLTREAYKVTDDEVAAAVRAYWTDTHNLAEGAGAAPLAAALQEKVKLAGKRVGLILSGGNIDFDLFSRWVGADAAVGERALA